LINLSQKLKYSNIIHLLAGVFLPRNGEPVSVSIHSTTSKLCL